MDDNNETVLPVEQRCRCSSEKFLPHNRFVRNRQHLTTSCFAHNTSSDDENNNTSPHENCNDGRLPRQKTTHLHNSSSDTTYFCSVPVRKSHRGGPQLSVLCAKIFFLLITDLLRIRTSAAQEQGFFNGHSLLRLEGTINLHSRTTLSFMTCTAQGELLYQERTDSNNKSADVLKIDIVPLATVAAAATINKNLLAISARRSAQPAPGIVRLVWKVAGRATAQHTINTVNIADGRGHLVDIHYKLGSLIFGVDSEQIIIANSTNNAELFDMILSPNNGIVTGRGFTGCIQGGVNLDFEPSRRLESSAVAWDRCSSPTSTMSFGCAAPLVDHCLSQPCRVGSICVAEPNRQEKLPYTCQCATRYAGAHCENDLGPLCLKPQNHCLNGGFCVEVNFGNSTRCRCPAQYRGVRCEELITDFCRSNTAELTQSLCKNGGTCVANAFNDGYVCQCPAGWSGAACEVEINECAALQPCAHGGACIDAVNGYACNCTGTGYTGPQCEVNIDECALSLFQPPPCGAGGTCFDTLGNYTCACPPGYEGQRCEIEVNECVALQQPCQNGASCRDVVNNYECLCAPGFTGRMCQVNIDDCVGVICPGNLVCIDGVNNSTCACPDGWVQHGAESLLCRPQSECVEHRPARCENGGKCLNLSDGFRCECLHGFTGKTCAKIVDPCLLQINKPVCQPNSVCVADPKNSTHGYACKCLAGFSGPQCLSEKAQNPCISIDTVTNVAVPVCENNGTCLKDGPDKFQCICVDGTHGERCEINFDDCAQQSCLHNATCEDLINDYKCHCQPGWSGRWCHKVFDACETTPCQHAGQCLSTPGAPDFKCECRPGFSGARCEINIDDCVGITCPDHKQVCYDLINSYKCDCAAGWTGPECAIAKNECDRKPCRNGATCSEKGDETGYTCACKPGYMGRQCERDIDKCSLPVSPCKNGAKCDNTPGSFRCFCVPGFIGSDCGREVNECLTLPCGNGATCINRLNGFDCRCAEGFQGATCELDVDECSQIKTPCENGASCANSFGSFNCTCAAGFEGKRCEINIDECATRPCLHGGVCIDGIANFQCNCNGTGFVGTTCNEKINECEIRQQPCQNGGTCADDVNDYHCMCLPALQGKNCTVDVPDCEPVNPCKNNGICVEHSKPDVFAQVFPNETFSWTLAAGATCICPSGFTGPNCEVNIDDCARAQTPCSEHGKCVDLVNEYECACDRGFEGLFCEQKIDICRRYRPCRNNGKCVNQDSGGYECQCTSEYGGRNCSVRLSACDDGAERCGRHGTCSPNLIEDNGSKIQAYTCRCEPGYAGDVCSKSSVLGFSGEQSFVNVKLEQHQRLQRVSFEFRTSLVEQGVLAALIHSNLLTDASVSEPLPPIDVEIALNNGSLQITAILVKHGGADLRNSVDLPLDKFRLHEWTRVDLEFTNAGDGLKVQLAQNISSSSSVQKQLHFINHTAFMAPLRFSRVWLGSAPLRFEQYIASNMPPQQPNFIGCMRDVNLSSFVVSLADIRNVNNNNNNARPVSDNAASNVRDVCSAQPQCVAGDECGSKEHRGTCIDLWSRHKCDCRRPFYGPACESENPAVTFGVNDRASSAVVPISSISENNNDAPLHAQLAYFCDVSFIMRTIEPSAFLFYLGSFDRTSHIELHLINSSTLWMALTLENFEKLYVEPTSNRVELSDGQPHFVRVIRERNVLRVLVDERVVIQDTVPGVALRAQVLHVGTPFDSALAASAANRAASITLSGKSIIEQRPTVKRFKRQQKQPPLMDAQPLLGTPSRPNYDSNLILVTRAPAIEAEHGRSAATPAEYFVMEDIFTAVPESMTAPTVINGDVLPLVSSRAGLVSSSTEALIDENYFKGILQDFRLNNRLVVFTEPSADLLRNTGASLIRAQQVDNVAPGVVSDDMCARKHIDGNSMCFNSGICRTTWYDFSCTCPPGFWGKRCELVDFCSGLSMKQAKNRTDSSICGIRQATCANLADGFECLTTATFNGRDSQIVYEPQFNVPALAENVINNISAEIRTREARVEALVRCKLLDYFIDIGIDGGRIVVDYILGTGGKTRLVSEDVRVDDGAWHTVTVVVGATALRVYVNATQLIGETRTVQKVSLAAMITGAASDAASRFGPDLSSQMLNSKRGMQITMASDNVRPAKTQADDPLVSFSHVQPTIILGKNFLGCMRNARFGPYLLPFLSSALNSGSVDNPAANKFAIKSLVNVNIGACGSSDACLTTTDRCVHGKCIDTWNSYRCECARGWTGPFCQQNLLGCEALRRSSGGSPPCRNNGTCQNVAGDEIKCWCAPGFSGARCENEIDECQSSGGGGDQLCQNGAQCEDLIDDFRCICPPEFTGKLCNTRKTLQCADQPCAADRTLDCVDRNKTAISIALETSKFALPRQHLTNFICTCREGAESDTCDSDIRYCRSNPCKNAALCYENETTSSTVASSTIRRGQKTFPTATSTTIVPPPLRDERRKYSCKCQAGWHGEHCEIDVDECAISNNSSSTAEVLSPCDTAHGKCVNEPGSYRCECDMGYTGARCQKPDCSTVQCRNGGQCQASDDGLSWKCDCTQSHYYGPLCNIQRPCLTTAAPQCLSGGVCVDLDPPADVQQQTPQFKCECPYNYTGSRCEEEVDFCLRNPCVNGNCTRTQQFPGYRCDCYAGWTGISDCKVDIDFCNPANHHLLNDEEHRRLLDEVSSPSLASILLRKGRMLVDQAPLAIPPTTSTATTTTTTSRRGGRAIPHSRSRLPAADAEVYENAVALPALQHRRAFFNFYSRNNSFTRPPPTSSVKTGSVAILGKYSKNKTKRAAPAADTSAAMLDSVSPALRGENNFLVYVNGDDIINTEPKALRRVASEFGLSTLAPELSTGHSMLTSRRSGVTRTDGTTVIDVVAFCGKHGVCRDANVSFVCACHSGFKGAHCEQDVDECIESEISPCQNGGACFNEVGSYRCECVHPFSGLNCAERTGYNKLSIILGISIGIALVIVVVSLTTLCCMAKKKRATRGTYSPSRQEMFGSRVEMNHVMRKPPQERLI